MEKRVPFFQIALMLAVAIVMAAPAYAQISTPCNASMTNSFSPCMNFLTNSSANGTSPTSDCCNALKVMTSGSMDCFCLIVTGSVPFRVPINRTLAISLPRACNMGGVPLQCKASGSPLPSPGPSSSPGSTPSASSGFTPSPAPHASSVLPSPITPTLAPQSDTTPLLTPPSPSVNSDTPTSTTGGGRSELTPSSAVSSFGLSPSLMLIVALGVAARKYF